MKYAKSFCFLGALFFNLNEVDGNTNSKSLIYIIRKKIVVYQKPAKTQCGVKSYFYNEITQMST